ncbi:DUF4867 family protein [Lachnoclostridium sp. Marseille-P6806]|uniref:DUF4867 family protein n=1 Tax=Lachnoclostridium sp. Marseille-P6806 TaxID=2364793 RepID=UPI00103193E0|nr:DUF4867 family protein [Lachnoclostridium sp. Marseille-P6806]
MKIYRVSDPEFAPYGRVLEDPSFAGLIGALRKKEMPKGNVVYVPGDPELEATEGGRAMQSLAFGELPVQVGYCNGDNTKLNALEYHRSSEINFAATDAVLMIGRQQDVSADMTYDTAKVEAFLIPEGTVVEVYATTLHYAPCNAPGKDGFQVGVALPAGTNLELGEKHERTVEDRHLTAVNKWLIGHPEGGLAEGSPLGLVGKNLDLYED